MSSHEFKFVSEGMFHQLDLKKDDFRAKQGDPQVSGRCGRILSVDWGSNDCRLDGVAESLFGRAVENHQNATLWLTSQSNATTLHIDLIKEVHFRMMAGLSENAGIFRTGEIAPLTTNHEPCDGGSIESSTRHLLEWVSAESFGELHPVQQAALVLVRLLDIYPFAEGTPRTCRVLSNLFLIKAGFPPAIFLPNEVDLYEQAIEAGFGMDTTKLTSHIAAALTRTLDFCLRGSPLDR